MKNQPAQLPVELLCFNAEKVYDWVLLQESVTENVSADDIGVLPIDPCDPAVSNLSINCYLVDPLTGNQLPPNAEIVIDEDPDDREDRDFVIDGTQVTLQQVNFEKTLSLVVEFSGFDGTTPFLEISDPIEINVSESVFLCAPEGTSIVVRVSDVICNASVNCDNGELESVDVSLDVCQSVQSVANVTLELEAGFCQPRDLLVTEECPTPVIPPQCPIVFPGITNNQSPSVTSTDE